MGHLIHSIHEQNYVAHVIAYASKIGPYQNEIKSKSHCSFSNIYLICMLLVLQSFIFNEKLLYC